jgi:hypothetical protein
VHKGNPSLEIQKKESLLLLFCKTEVLSKTSRVPLRADANRPDEERWTEDVRRGLNQYGFQSQIAFDELFNLLNFSS